MIREETELQEEVPIGILVTDQNGDSLSRPTDSTS